MGLRTQHVTEVCMVSSHLCWGGKGKYWKCKESWEKYLMNSSYHLKTELGGRGGVRWRVAAGSSQPAAALRSHRQGMPPQSASISGVTKGSP